LVQTYHKNRALPDDSQLRAMVAAQQVQLAAQQLHSSEGGSSTCSSQRLGSAHSHPGPVHAHGQDGSAALPAPAQRLSCGSDASAAASGAASGASGGGAAAMA
jgi:hypothetical protein